MLSSLPRAVTSLEGSGGWTGAAVEVCSAGLLVEGSVWDAWMDREGSESRALEAPKHQGQNIHAGSIAKSQHTLVSQLQLVSDTQVATGGRWEQHSVNDCILSQAALDTVKYWQYTAWEQPAEFEHSSPSHCWCMCKACGVTHYLNF